MSNYIHVFDEETKKILLNQGFRLIKNDFPYIFADNKDNRIAFSKIDKSKYIINNNVHF